MIMYLSNGSRITAAANVTNDIDSGGNNYNSIITYDHIHNLVWLEQSGIKHLTNKVLAAWKNCGYILQSDVFIKLQ